MKWPASVTLVRHAESAYNELRQKKREDSLYDAFLTAFERDHRSPEARRLALEVKDRYTLGFNDFEMPLTEAGRNQARITGKHLHEVISLPEVIFYSPYRRTCDTLTEICGEWPVLKSVRMIEEDRIREQEHGLALLYNDRRVMHVLHPEQKELRDLLGPYWYQQPQGESVSQVRDRARAVITMLIRECAGQRVLMITHHLMILSWRANIERLTPAEFIRLDAEEEPFNCGITHYEGNPSAGNDGKLELKFYNKKLY